MLQQITIDGKQFPINFGIRTMAATADAMGITLDSLVKKSALQDVSAGSLFRVVIAVAAVALTEGARKSGQPHRYTEDDVADLLDKDMSAFPTLLGMFRSSVGDGSTVFQTATPAADEGGGAAGK